MPSQSPKRSRNRKKARLIMSAKRKSRRIKTNSGLAKAIAANALKRQNLQQSKGVSLILPIQEEENTNITISTGPALCVNSDDTAPNENSQTLSGKELELEPTSILTPSRCTTISSHVIHHSTPQQHLTDISQESKELLVSDDSDWMEGIAEIETTTSTNTRVEENCSRNQEVIQMVGRRIVNMSHFITSIQRLEIHHPFDCSFSDMDLINDKQIGLVDELTFICRMCKRKEKITTDVISGGTSCLDLNTAVVSAMTNIGQGYSQLEEICCTLDMPCMTNKTYRKYEQRLNATIHDVAWESMEAAAREEARIAISEGSVDTNGIPEITVVTDGAWCKRSYKTNYNALSGVACIMGFRTKKVLFIGIRNSYCCICARAQTKGIQVSQHLCYKNWNKTSTAMESDIILEGFRKSIDMYNLKYVNVIGDGDSSVMKKLRETQPYGPQVILRKIECSNHLLRNYIRKLREVGKKRRNHLGPIPGDLRHKITCNLQRLRYAVTAAVKYSQISDEDKHTKLQNLKYDLANGPYHVFGDHTKCKQYFCSGPKEKNINFVEHLRKYGVWSEIMAANNFLSNYTDSLLQCVTSNIAESFNARLCKFVGGKRVNFAQRDSYTVRSELSAIAVNEADNLHRCIYKKITVGHSPGMFSKRILKRKQHRKLSRKTR